MKNLLLIALFATTSLLANAQITITANHTDSLDAWIHIKLTDTINQQSYFDSLIYVSADEAIFSQSFDLPSSVFKCEILNISENMNLPIVKLNNGSIIHCDEEFEHIIFDN